MKKFYLLIAAISCTLVMKAAPEGAKPGLFSIAAGKQVYFSQGNLQFQAAGNLWKFADDQNTILGQENNQISSITETWIDLFHWGTSGWEESGAKEYQPWAVSEQDADYYVGGNYKNGLSGYYANADWGIYNPIQNGGKTAGIWRTLSYEEWNYLLYTRPMAADKRGMAKVGGVNGLVILPDQWTLPDGLNFNPKADEWNDNQYQLNIMEWDKMDEAGAIFLPCAGARTGYETNGVNKYALYWSSSYYDSNNATAVSIDETGLNINGAPRGYGVSVRLVQDAAAEGVEEVDAEQQKSKSQKIFRNGQLYIIKNGRTYNALGVEIR